MHESGHAVFNLNDTLAAGSEYINDARLNPKENAGRYISSYDPLKSVDPEIQSALNFFSVSGAALLSQYNGLMPAQPLAWNDAIASAARAHSQAMITADTQSHQLPGEPGLGARITAAGYSWNTLGENVFAFSKSRHRRERPDFR